MAGIVTKQALSKYEQGKAEPSPVVLGKLAGALGVKAVHLWAEPEVAVQFVAYRKRSRLGKREQERVESLACQALEERVRLQELTGQTNGSKLPIKELPVRSLEDAELAARQVRKAWNLGLAPIASVVDVLESHFVHVLEVDAKEEFDGISAVAHDDDKNVVAAAVVTRGGIAGERQRLNLTHELGHLVLKINDKVNEEAAAFRFGGSFLAPADVLRRDVGIKRNVIDFTELHLLRKRYGMSLQALLHRLCDLEVIGQAHYRKWCRDISMLGWKKREPGESEPEQPQWLRRTVLHALAEELITKEHAENLLGEKLKAQTPLGLMKARAFMRLPLEERRRILERQAANAAAFSDEHYAEWKQMEGGDIVEY
jgi:transcriptional regulator with XRE-family HTH domain